MNSMPGTVISPKGLRTNHARSMSFVATLVTLSLEFNFLILINNNPALVSNGCRGNTELRLGSLVQTDTIRDIVFVEYGFPQGNSHRKIKSLFY